MKNNKIPLQQKTMNMKALEKIQLISSNDQAFLNYVHGFNNRSGSENKREKYKSEMIAYVFELATREWVKSSGKYFDKRIIAFERYDFQLKKNKVFFEEIDFVLKEGKNLILGEVKSSYSAKGVFQKASEQLIRKGELLKKIGYKVSYQIIFFDLCYHHTKRIKNQFMRDYNKMNFSIAEFANQSFEIAHLNPTEFFDWGVEQHIIKTPELLKAAVEEAEMRNSIQKNKTLSKAYIIKPIGVSTDNFRHSTQGLCDKSETKPLEADIKKILRITCQDDVNDDTIIIARHKWLKMHSFVIPDSKKIMNLCIQIKNKKIVRAFYTETIRELFKKLNYNIFVYN
jgi:hypothetical protein